MRQTWPSYPVEMSITSETVTSVESVETVPDRVAALRSTFETGVTRSLEWREEQLDGLLRFCDEQEDALIEAIATDLGRPWLEAYAADIGTTAAEIKHLRKNVKSWMKPRKAKLPLTSLPAKGRIMAEPLGVALVIAPWNYPVQLLLEPIAAALAAGNTVAAKPSELSPATSGVIASRLGDYVDSSAVAVFEGDVPVSTALLEQRFDHIFFTGSTRVGQIVMQAAAKHLTPVTLELGGKSPCIVDDSIDLELAAHRIAFGKWLNAGQTCIAPDYVLVSESRRDALVDELRKTLDEFYGDDPQTTKDFGRIVNRTQFDRLVGYLDGQTVAIGGQSDASSNYLAPTVVVDPPLDSALMTDEIFGPILPIVAVDDLAAAIRFVNERPKPLALYVFSDDDEATDRVLVETSSGGACVNHTLLHITPPDLPFGGVGPSGMGRYHGETSFETFSNMKSVLHKPLKGENSILYPPYKGWKEKLVKKAL